MPSIIKLITVFILVLAVYPAHATRYLYLDAENGVVGNSVPNPPLCQTQCSGRGEPATYQSIGGTPQGTNYYQWQTVDNQLEHYTSIRPQLAADNILGKTIYLAYYFRFDTINNREIWHSGTGIQSGDKGPEIDGNGIRWILSRGQWEGMAANQPGHYTVWMGNPTYHLNRSIEYSDAIRQNQNGYSSSNPIQLQYGVWYSAVMAVKIASDNSGSIATYINGVKILEYTNIRTAANNTPTISSVTLGGTIAQPAYDSPAHFRKFDGFMLTDSWQDILDGGYLSLVKVPKAPFAY